MSKFKSRFPFYKDDSDYTTNAISYYEDLARKTKLIQYLAEKIAGYEVILQTSLEEIEGILAQVIDKIGEGFNVEIADLLVLWVEDGTLDHIINETLMNKKADKTELQALETALNDAMGLLETTLTTQMENLETSTNEAMTQLETDTNDIIQNTLTQAQQMVNDLENDVKIKAPYHNISYERFYNETIKTDCYLTHVKTATANGKLTLGYQKLTGQNTTVVEQARKDNHSVAINAGMFGANNSVQDYHSIINGQAIFENYPSSPKPYRHYLAIMSDGSLRSYPTTASINTLLAEGVIHATSGFAPMYENGQKQTNNMTNYDAFNERHPRQIIAQTLNGDYYILTIGGRGVDGEGATVLEAYDILMDKVLNVIFAYNLDGGGSTQTVVRGNMINPTYSGNGASELRKRPDMLYIEEFEPIGNRDEVIQALSHDIAEIKDTLHFVQGVQYGEWTPLIGSVDNYTEPSVEYTTNTGNYVRIGNVVIAHYFIEVANKGTGTGIMRVRGLPMANETTNYVTSIIDTFEGLDTKDPIIPFMEQLATGTMQTKGIRSDTIRTSEEVLITFNTVKDSFKMIGTHIFIVDAKPSHNT